MRTFTALTLATTSFAIKLQETLDTDWRADVRKGMFDLYVKYDTDNDGKLSQEEFIELCKYLDEEGTEFNYWENMKSESQYDDALYTWKKGFEITRYNFIAWLTYNISAQAGGDKGGIDSLSLERWIDLLGKIGIDKIEAEGIFDEMDVDMDGELHWREQDAFWETVFEDISFRDSYQDLIIRAQGEVEDSPVPQADD